MLSAAAAARSGRRPRAARRSARASARRAWPASSPPRWKRRFQPTSGPALERAGDLAAILTNLDDGDVLFIDEVHRLPRPVEEVLYPAMEDFQLDIVIGKGPSARTIRLDLPRFTLVGATTRTGLITGPLRDRFGFVARLDYYVPDELTAILARAGADPRRRRSIPKARREIAQRSRGHAAHRQPAAEARARLRRGARRRHRSTHDDRARRARAVRGRRASASTRSTARSSARCAARSRGRAVGLGTLAVAVGEAPETVEDVYEPFLLQCGLLERTPRGRVATPAAFEHLGLARSRRARRGSGPVLSRRGHARRRRPAMTNS